jgi:flagellar protein FlaG
MADGCEYERTLFSCLIATRSPVSQVVLWRTDTNREGLSLCASPAVVSSFQQASPLNSSQGVDMSSNDLSVSANAGAAVRDAHVAKAAPPPQEAAKTAKAEAPAKPKLTVNPEEKRRAVQEAVAEMNRHMQSQNRNLAFQVDDVANRTVVTVRHQQTGEVVRQIPDESVLRVAHNIEAMKGLMHDKPA